MDVWSINYDVLRRRGEESWRDSRRGDRRAFVRDTPGLSTRGEILSIVGDKNTFILVFNKSHELLNSVFVVLY